MKLSLTLSLLLGMATLFQGCGTAEDAPKAAKDNSIVISGATTLNSSRFDPDKAMVCLDIDKDGICTENDPQALANDIGEYKITVETQPKDGTIIIATGGYSLLLRDDQNLSIKNVIDMHKSYHKDEKSANVNIMSHVVYLDMEQNVATYQDSLNNIAQTYNYDTTSILLEDPIRIAIQDKSKVGTIFDGPGVKYYYNAIAIEKFIAEKTVKNKAPSLVVEAATEEDSLIPSLDDLTIDTTLFDSYLDDLSQYFSDFWDYWFGDDTVEVTPDPDPEPEPVKPQVVEIQRDNLNGIWYIIDASGDKTCSDIRSNGDIAVTEADGKTTNLSLTYNNTKKTMLLKLGFFTADTIKFDKYYDNETFTGNYESDGETLKGIKVVVGNNIAEQLDSCKHDSDKLGLK